MVPDVKLLPPEDEDKVLKQWNSNTLEVPQDACVHDLFIKMAKAHPDAVACSYENSNQSLSYRQLDLLTNYVANHLKSIGCKPDDLIGVCLSRGITMLVAMIGIMKSGAAYVALDPKFPHDRLAFIVEEAEIQTVIVEEELSSFVDAFVSLISRKETTTNVTTEKNGNFVTTTTTSVQKEISFSISKLLASEFMKDFETVEERAVNEKYQYSSSSVVPANLAYAIYTSGSTGKPKGVLLEHRTVVNFLLSMEKSPGMKRGQSLLAVTTICFDISVLELFLPITCGGKVVIVGSQTSRDGTALLNLLNTLKINIMQATPATWMLLLETGWKGDDKLTILCGGEPLPVSLANRLSPIVESLWNMYGPTEVTVWCTIKKIDRPLTANPTIGKPIHNTTAYILDRETLKPVAIGEQGELYLGGFQCARGYNKNEAVTKERFIPDPFCGRDDGKMYKSGDLARWSDAGELICCGRADYQVKINGFRIELGEIETVLDKYPNMKSCVVSAMDVAGSKQLVAFVVWNEPQQLNISELQSHIERDCSAYMVPSIFIELEGLPLLPNGKVDRNSLPKPDVARAQITQALVEEPTNAIEERLVSFCEELLGTSPISIKVNLFTIGGNSLFAVKLHNKIKSEWNIELTVTIILQSQNISIIGSKIGRAINPNTEESEMPQNNIIAPINSSGDNPPLFLFHPAGGFLFPYFNVSGYLNRSQPIYGIQDPCLMDESRPFKKSIEEMAEEYLEALIEFYPEGPYYLGGWSMGGFLALEVAQRLTALDKPVAALLIIDQVPKEGQFSKTDFWLDNIFKGGALTKQQIAIKYTKLKQTNSIFRRGAYGIAHWILGAEELKDDMQSAAMNSGIAMDPSASLTINILNSHMKTVCDYVPKPYQGNAVIYRCRDGEDINQFIAWKNIIPQCQIIDVPGSHFTVLTEPFVQDLAQQMNASITEAIYRSTNIPRETIGVSRMSVLAYGEADTYTGSSITHQMGYASSNRKSSFAVLSGIFKPKPETNLSPTAVQWECFTLSYHWPGEEINESTLVHHKQSDLKEMKSNAKKSQRKYLVQEEIVVLRGSIVTCVAELKAPEGIKGLKMVMDVSVGQIGLLSKNIKTQEIEFGDLPPKEDAHHLRFIVFQTKHGDVVKMPKGKYNVMIHVFDDVGHVLYRMLVPIFIKDPVGNVPSTNSLGHPVSGRVSLS